MPKRFFFSGQGPGPFGQLTEVHDRLQPTAPLPQHTAEGKEAEGEGAESICRLQALAAVAVAQTQAQRQVLGAPSTSIFLDFLQNPGLGPLGAKKARHGV